MKIGDTVKISNHGLTGEIVDTEGDMLLVHVPQFSIPIMCYPCEVLLIESAPVKRGRKFRLLLLAIITLIIGVASYLIADGKI